MGKMASLHAEGFELPDDEKQALEELGDWVAFSRTLSRTFGEAQALLEKKHRDYGPKNISDSPGGPLNGLRVRMHDKLARINHLIDSGATPENESLRDSFIDLANYSVIALLVIDGEWGKNAR